jgi:hypothetical protein
MSRTTFELLASLEGREASLSGQTQIRAGAVRPELVAPATGPAREEPAASAAEVGELATGSRVRLIRHPHFGLVGTVVELPEMPAAIPTGAKLRVLAAELGDGRRLVVPRSNVELFVG